MQFSLEELTPSEFLQHDMERGDLIMERARREEEAMVLARIMMLIRNGGAGRRSVAIDELDQNDVVTVFPQFSKDTKAGYVLKPNVDFVDDDASREMAEKIREMLNTPADFDVYHPQYIRRLPKVTRDKLYQKCFVEQRGIQELWVKREYWIPSHTVIQCGKPLMLYKNGKKKGPYDSIMVGGIQVLKGFFKPRIQAV